jgi:hypothetical protein
MSLLLVHTPERVGLDAISEQLLIPEVSGLAKAVVGAHRSYRLRLQPVLAAVSSRRELSDSFMSKPHSGSPRVTSET